MMKQKILKKIVSSEIYRKVLAEVIPYIRFSTAHNDICGSKYQHGYSRLRPGQILLSVDRQKLTTMLIPGEFSHAAFCVAKGDSGRFEIAEMTHKDYTESYFYDLCREADRIVLLECVAFDDEYVHQMIGRCLSYRGTPYDVEFDLSDDSLYCCELVYQSDFERRLDVSLEDTGIGYKYLSPDGLYRAGNVRVVWDSND